MKKRSKLIVLTIVMVILIVLVVKQSMSFYYAMKGLPLPSPQSRLDNPITVHRWMSVNEVAEHYGLSEQEVFELLQISPQPGDETLTLRELKIKYNKSQEEMLENVQRILYSSRKLGQSP